jgi:hypothetical protein
MVLALGTGTSAQGHNPVGVGGDGWDAQPRVAARTPQPWALLHCPVGASETEPVREGIASRVGDAGRAALVAVAVPNALSGLGFRHGGGRCPPPTPTRRARSLSGHLTPFPVEMLPLRVAPSPETGAIRPEMNSRAAARPFRTGSIYGAPMIDLFCPVLKKRSRSRPQPHWPLATGYWPLPTGYWPLATGYSPTVTDHWSLITGH